MLNKYAEGMQQAIDLTRLKLQQQEYCRPCIVKIFDGNSFVPRRGTFHQFGLQDGNTTAIVELEDGRLVVLEPNEVTFTDKM